MKERTIQDLKQLQALPLQVKIEKTKLRIGEWIERFGTEGVYISFSGGKDSTVLMDIVRNKMGYSEIPALFIDVPTQFPELKAFAMTWDNVIVVKPNISFMKVCDTYGFPLISKEISQTIAEARSAIKNGTKNSIRLKQLNGEEGVRNKGKYAFLVDAPFAVSHKCCGEMKKKPAYQYEKETGRKGITAQMASESVLRREQWLANGCNAFDSKRPMSNPMSFWTEQDVLRYLKSNNVKICSVYGEIVEDFRNFDGVDGQLTMSDIDESFRCFDCEAPPLKVTGYKRTGCMLCGFGQHLYPQGEGSFELLKQSHPGMYAMLDVVQNNGVTMREAIDWVNEHGNLHIRY